MKGMEMDERIEAAREAVLAAGELVRESFDGRNGIDVEEKDRNDYVTGTDRASEELIISMLTAAFPDIPVMGEEGGGSVGEKLFWVIDPLDGTTNFIHGYPQVGVSVALIEDRTPVVAVTYDPLRNEVFEAGRGEGAFCNGRPLSVSNADSLEKCLLGTGFPFRTYEYFDPYLDTFRKLFLNCRGVRRAGAAVLDLAHVAAGRLDGFWELYLKPWDMAAGALMISEAGGIVTDFFGGDGFLAAGNIVAGSRAIHSEIVEVTAGSFTKEGVAALANGLI
jgi:myo-inositol-1(or 4)-monophosphatase